MVERTSRAEYMREYRKTHPQKRYDKTETKRAYRQRLDGDARGTLASRLPFVGVDGEGGNINGRHEYLLLRAGTQTLYTGSPLTPSESLRFLSSLPPDKIYVGFYFDYDVTMILRDLPPEKVLRLIDKDSRKPSPEYRQPFPLDYGPYQIEYMARKHFRVRVRPKHGEKRPWVTINDVGSFFQCAFVTALEKWEIGTAEQRKAIGDGKNKRAGFKELDAETDAYNALEIELLQSLMESFRAVCREVGYIPTRWQGPGWVAAKMLATHGVVKSKDLDIIPGLAAAAQSAYYGGRFETSRIGAVPDDVYQYDINSAYPAALTRLPCLVHGTWRHGIPTPGDLALHHVKFRPKRQTYRAGAGDATFDLTYKPLFYNFPIRNKQGRISFPATGSGWYWSVEVEQAIHQTVKIDESWVYEKHCDCEPFKFIPDVYAERIRVGKTARGTVLKLALNSLYGKMCQSVGSAPYANPIWASLITAITRAQLSELTHQPQRLKDGYCCDDTYMLATDGVFCGPRDVPTSKELGGWDLDIHRGRDYSLFIIQPGVYFTPNSLAPKTRGVPRQIIIDRLADFIDSYNGFLSLHKGEIWIPPNLDGTASDLEGVWPNPLPIPVRSFTGLRLAVARGKPHTAGTWVSCPTLDIDPSHRCTLECPSVRGITFNVSSKRTDVHIRSRTGDLLSSLRTYPLHGDARETVPYAKAIGGVVDNENLAYDLEYADRPDWAPFFFGEGM